jgi:hypothetical protein
MPKERRVHLRKPLQELAYLSLPSNNGGVLTDISEGGLGFHAIGPVEAVGPLHIRFAIDSAERIAAVGELAWSDASGKIGGLRFTLLPDGVREKIRAWAERSELRPAVNAGDGAISQSASFAAAASIGRNNFAAAVDVLGLNRRLRPAPQLAFVMIRCRPQKRRLSMRRARRQPRLPSGRLIRHRFTKR